MLSMEEVRKIKEWFLEEMKNKKPMDNTGTCLNLIDAIEAQQQEIEQLRAVLAKARETILSVFRENPSQENIEFAEHVVAEIDKVLNA